MFGKGYLSIFMALPLKKKKKDLNDCGFVFYFCILLPNSMKCIVENMSVGVYVKPPEGPMERGVNEKVKCYCIVKYGCMSLNKALQRKTNPKVFPVQLKQLRNLRTVQIW